MKQDFKYIGRFAPSPTGPLHRGSLVAALASYLDARAHGGQWLVRIEDIDPERSTRAWGEQMLAELAHCGLVSDGPVWWQSARVTAYQAVFDQLEAARLVFPCSCTRQMLAQLSDSPAYPGTCRHGMTREPIRSWRLLTERARKCRFIDRMAGPQSQHVSELLGDFTLRRADGSWAYQLAVVVDDAAQGVTHVVRGDDLLESTAPQAYLQKLLGLPTPQYLHVPVLRGPDGLKLSKQNGAAALELKDPLSTLKQCLHDVQGQWPVSFSGALRAAELVDFWALATAEWRAAIEVNFRATTHARH